MENPNPLILFVIIYFIIIVLHRLYLNEIRTRVPFELLGVKQEDVDNDPRVKNANTDSNIVLILNIGRFVLFGGIISYFIFKRYIEYDILYGYIIFGAFFGGIFGAIFHGYVQTIKKVKK